MAAFAAACLVFQMFLPATADPLQSEYLSACSVSYSIPTHAAIHQTLQFTTQASDSAYRQICAGNYADAEQLLRQVLSLQPDHFAARCNLGYILNRTGRAKEALPHLLYAFYNFPNKPAVLQLLAGSYQLIGNLPAAIQFCRLYLSAFPSAPDRSYMEAVTQHLIAETAGRTTQNHRWNKKTIRVFVQAPSNVRGYRSEFDQILKSSFKTWSDSGVINFEFVSKIESADIECVWTDDTRQLGTLAEGGEALVRHRENTISGARIVLLTNRAHGVGALHYDEVRALCIHEIGHALGLMRHSRNPSDAMYFTVASNTNPSAADIQQLKKLYSSSY